MITEHDALMEAIERRMIRIESKLSALMQSMGFDTRGQPLAQKPTHPQTLFDVIENVERKYND